MHLQSTFIVTAVLLLLYNYTLFFKKNAKKSRKLQSLGIQQKGFYVCSG